MLVKSSVEIEHWVYVLYDVAYIFGHHDSSINLTIIWGFNSTFKKNVLRTYR